MNLDRLVNLHKSHCRCCSDIPRKGCTSRHYAIYNASAPSCQPLQRQQVTIFELTRHAAVVRVRTPSAAWSVQIKSAFREIFMLAAVLAAHTCKHSMA
jgi:hypothetical protein